MISLVMITGASRGIGQAIASSLHPLLLKKGTTGVVYVLIARSSVGLQGTVDKINQQLSQRHSSNAIDVKILSHVVDLEDLSTLETSMSDILTSIGQCFDTTMLFNNAGSVGPLGYAHSLTSLSDIQRAVNLNVTSSIWLSSLFIQKFGPLTQRLCRVVNISSLCAIQPFQTMSVYCAVKAAREMFHSVLAKDIGSVSDSFPSSIKILNYAPGPCKTEMSLELIQSTKLDLSISQYFNDAYNEGSLIDPYDSADRLIQLLMKDEYESGAHVDYFDLKNKT